MMAATTALAAPAARTIQVSPVSTGIFITALHRTTVGCLSITLSSRPYDTGACFTGPLQVAEVLLDQLDATGERSRGHVDELESEVAVGLLVDLLEGERVVQGDPPGRGRLDEALAADEEGRRLVAAIGHETPGLPGEPRRLREA